MFIVIEGIDGCGKTRVIEELKKRLEEKGNKVFLTKEPFDNRIKELIKSIIKEEHPKNKYFGLFLACLFAADRYLHQIEIEDKLNQNFIIISDRYYYSSFSYQSNYENFDLE
ncbi:MAG: dTMP kinase, partial [Nanopusillaceae archaeon]